MQAVTFTLASFGSLVLLLALSRWLAGRRWACLGHLALAAVLLLSAAWLHPIAANLATYQARRMDAPIAELACERTSTRSYRVTLTRLPAGHMQVFEVSGDQWQIDARTLAWRDKPLALGLKPAYRLDRLSTRFVRAAEDESAPPSSYALVEEVGDDVWAQARIGTAWSTYAVAEHAQGPWLPLADAARYQVSLERGGLVARPLNEAAAKALAAQPASRDAVPAG
jgi:hypothetical protein